MHMFESLPKRDATPDESVLVEQVYALRTRINNERRPDLNDLLMFEAINLKRAVIAQFGSGKCLQGIAAWQSLVGGTREEDVIPTEAEIAYVNNAIRDITAAVTERFEASSD